MIGTEIGDGLQSLTDSLIRDCPEKATSTVQANTESVVIAVILVNALITRDTSASQL